MVRYNYRLAKKDAKNTRRLESYFPSGNPSSSSSSSSNAQLPVTPSSSALPTASIVPNDRPYRSISVSRFASIHRLVIVRHTRRYAHRFEQSKRHRPR